MSNVITAALVCDPAQILTKQTELESVVHAASSLEDKTALMHRELADYHEVLGELGEEYCALKVSCAFT